MKNTSHILFLLLAFVSGIFDVRAINNVWASFEVSEGRGTLQTYFYGPTPGLAEHQIGKTQPIQASDYDYMIGMNLEHALLDVRSNRNCSIIYGVIQNLKSDEKNEYVKNVDFFIEEWLAGKSDAGKNDLQLSFYTEISNKANWNEKPFENAKFEVGNKLILSHCPNNFFRLAVTDQVSLQYYLRRIKTVIEYDAANIAGESSGKILDILGSEKSRVFTGYIIERFRHLVTGHPVTVGEGDNRAIVLTELVGTKYVPKRESWKLLLTLEEYFSEDYVLTLSTRNALTKKLFEMSSGDNLDEAEQAVPLLVKLIQKDKINIQPYLTAENLPNLRQNYRLLGRKQVSAEAREKFERLIEAAKYQDNNAKMNLSATPPADLEPIILGADYDKAEAALMQAISEKQRETIQSGLKSRFIGLQIRSAEALAEINDKSSVAALVEALSQNQGVRGGGTEDQVLQQNLNKAIILALAKLTELKFQISWRLAENKFHTNAPFFDTFTPDEIENVLDETRKWLSSQKKDH